jgi:hypothetical protein
LIFLCLQIHFDFVLSMDNAFNNNFFQRKQLINE